MICSYCQTTGNSADYCSFCKAELTEKRPKINKFLSAEKSELTQPELVNLHTYDLLLILRHLRTKRTEWYKLMQTVRRAPEEAKKDDYEESKEYSIQEYRNLTARKNVVEQILVDRMGYYPERIDDKLLNALMARIQRQAKA